MKPVLIVEGKRYEGQVVMYGYYDENDVYHAISQGEPERVEWVDVGGNNTEFQKYHPGTNYPIRSERFFTVGGYHSPDDLKIPGLSLVVGRTTSTYSLGGGE